MKFGLRIPSLKRRFAARTSVKRYVRHSLGIKMPRGYGFITNPKKAVYNKIYNKTSFSLDKLLKTPKSKTNKQISSVNPSVSLSWIKYIFIAIFIFTPLWPLSVGYFIYKIYKHSKNKSNSTENTQNKSTVAIIGKNNEIIQDFQIPEPTKSLVWVTNESSSKIASPMEIRVSFKIENGEIKGEFNNQPNFFAEPSLLWTQLPVEVNDELETNPMYYPTYSQLSQKQRYQYINWLRNIEQKTNLSYVFLYFYGLERHLVIGNFDLALEETIRLEKTQDLKFRAYIVNSLVGAIALRKRFDVIEKISFIFDEASNTTLGLRSLTRKSLTAKEMMKLAYRVEFKNRKYIKEQPELFEKELEKLIKEFEEERGLIWDLIDPKLTPQRDQQFFLNLSIPSEIRSMVWPQIIDNVEFKNIIHKLLSDTHQNVKELLKIYLLKL
jgi:hypothetical protein